MKASASAKITFAFYITLKPHNYPLMNITQVNVVNFNSPDGFYTWEATDNEGGMIATIVYDDEQHLSWGVFVNDIEVHRTHTTMRAQNYVIWHFKQGTLPIWESVEKIDNESETMSENDIELNNFSKLFTHVKKSFVKITLAIVITSSTIVYNIPRSFSYELPLNGLIGSPVITPKPKPAPKPYRGGQRREVTRFQ